MNELTQVKPSEVVAVQGSTQIISMIGSLASDPNANIDKMERLMSMHERLLDREAKIRFDDSLAEMQPKIPAIEERGKITVSGTVRSTYPLWEDINTVIKPILSEHGFSLTFKTETKPEIKVVGFLRKSGHVLESEFIASADNTGSKNSIQAVKSTISYGKRIIADALLNITSHGEDDDAYSTSEVEFDTSPWTESIRESKNMDELNIVAAKMGKTDIPNGALAMLRSAYAGRASDIRKAASDAA